MNRALPDFPWDTLAEAAQRARAHPDGLVDLSVGTPVDPTPELAQRALAAAADAPGYPQTAGTPELRRAMASWLSRRWGARDLAPEACLPVLGTKELVGWLPTLLGLGPADVVVFPRAAYPTYRVGALMAGARAVAADHPDELDPGVGPVRLVWVNSPSNPTGEVLDAERLGAWVRWCREHGAVLASDECYGELGWEAEPVSVLHPSVCGASSEGLLALHSLSKRSNLAGYRAGFVAGDAALVGALLAVRKHLGMIMPAPVQAAMTALLDDDEEIAAQRERYRRRRALLRPALEAAGYRLDHSTAGLYLWATRGEDARATVDRLADLGILVAPGDFYGEPEVTGQHVRIALTATDERVAAAAERLGA
ncbi:succinyldiaminopimelate transaminase [Desertihabitans brevis]|uniref:Aminotransferase n=1 Tax=Desertihabitans brevis TaxID=2268447 RepID=A0A367YS87_9ACTN|nr:succinyldiaminopimelate transaminase [Desertihabitans brevis]RCK68617.1 succinyldiaminopimelate transaminase [Desertihabitans brevis]